MDCWNGALVLTAAAALTWLMLPARNTLRLWLRLDPEKSLPPIVAPPPQPPRFAAPTYPSLYTPIILFVLGVIAHIFDFVHRKLFERRILKMRQVLSASTARLRAAEQRKAELEGTLRLTRSAAAEYNLLLYLLLRRRRTAAA